MSLTPAPDAAPDAGENRYCATCRRTERFTRCFAVELCRVCGRVLHLVDPPARGLAR
jgi:hypothetical protein